MSDDRLRGTAGEAAKSISEVGPIDPKKWSEFAANLYYQAGEYGSAEDFQKLAKRLDDLSAAKKLGGDRLFFLFTPPGGYPPNVEEVGRAGRAKAASPGAGG